MRILVVVLAMLLAGCAVNPVTGGRDFVLMSETEELALGREHHQKIIKQYRIYDNPTLQQYVRSVGDRVARVSHRQNLIYRFTLLDSAQVNAFALPGGYIYITRGLLAYLNSEAELAAVLGHELGHVTARHSVRQHSFSTTTRLLGGLIAAATGVQGAGQLTDFLSTGIVRGYGREHELEADGLGVEYLVKAGYRASAMKQVISVLKNQEVFDKQLAIEQGRKPRAYHGIFSTHPDNDVRLQTVLNRMGAQAVTADISDRQDVAFLQKLSGLTFGDSSEDGVILGNNFYHVDLDFKMVFPKGWVVTNSPNSIAASSLKNEALIQLVLQDLNKKLTPKQFLKARFGIKQAISEAPLLVAGRRGHTAVINGKTPYGQGKLRVAVLFDESRAFVFFAAIKQEKNFAYFDKQVIKSINSLSALNRIDRLVATELRIELLTVNRRNNSIRRMTKNSPINNHAEQQTRLLNDLFPKGEPKAGDLIKIVR